MQTGTEKGFSLSDVLSLASNPPSLVITRAGGSEIEVHNDGPTVEISVPSQGFSEQTAWKFWLKMKASLSVHMETQLTAVFSNFTEVLFNPLAKMNFQCIFLLPVLSDNVYLGLLNVTCSAKEGSEPNIKMIRPLDIAKFIAKSLLVHKWRNSALTEARKAARASILARNFSHVTGSHVVSNPGFAMTLAGDGVWHKWQTALIDHADRFDSAFDRYSRLNRATENPSNYWLEGGQILADMAAAFAHGGVLLEQTRMFHHFLQGRFDFIARAVDDVRDRQEPVNFVEDMLDGFLTQSAYLDTLVRDLGVRLPKLNLQVILPEGIRFQTKWRRDKETETNAWWHEWVQIDGEPGMQKDIRHYSTMVGIPGGLISCHAFYSLLENIIRNSVKYGSHREAVATSDLGYLMMLNLNVKDRDTFLLRIHDNCSCHGNQNSAYEKLFKLLGRDILDEMGLPQKEGLGVQEMVICAESLQTSLRSRSGQTASPTEKALRLLQNDALDQPTETKCITFELTLSKPVLACIWTQAGVEENEGIVLRTPDLSFMVNMQSDVCSTGYSPHLLVVDGRRDPEATVEFLEKWHASLPFRLFVACDGVDQRDKWRRSIATSTALPAGRLRVAIDENLQNRLLSIELNGAGSDAVREDFVLACYDAWLRAWKGEIGINEPWDLWIGFERSKALVESVWKPLLERFGQRKMNSIRIFLRTGRSGGDAEDVGCSGMTIRSSELISYWKREFSAPICDKRALLFDNHGICFPEALNAEKTGDPRKGARFYQRMGVDTSDLFQTLFSPPASPFAFAFFIYSLVESCLANIAIVDERVAADLLFGQASNGERSQTEFRLRLTAHQKAGVYPLFSFRHVPRIETGQSKNGRRLVGSFTHAHDQSLKKFLFSDNTGIPDLQTEGVSIDALGNETRADTLISRDEGGFDLFQLLASNEIEDCPVPNCPEGSKCVALPLDAIVIHEGAIDLINKDPIEKWHQNMTPRLWRIAPLVVRTSGRGRHTRHFLNRIPFIEFNEVSSALLTSRNKFAFVRGIFGTCSTSRDISENGVL